MAAFSRRDLLKTAGIASAAVTVTNLPDARAEPTQSAQTAGSSKQSQGQQPAGSPQVSHTTEDILFFFNSDEAKFVRAAVDRLIPADDKWGGADAAGVLYFIDRQLASAYGAGARMYLKGPWKPDAPAEQGYQLRYSPADLYRVAIPEVLDGVRKQNSGKDFWDLSDKDKDKFLKALEHGDLELQSLPGPVFFETLLANTIEGFFADPVYGGNRGMVGWRMIGFPGAYAQYVGLVDQHGIAYTREPLSIASSFTELGEHDHMHQHAEK